MANDIAVLVDADAGDAPRPEDLQAWANAALAGRGGPFSLAIRVVGLAQGRRLNREYRGQDRPTNVLSFITELPPEVLRDLDAEPLGDLVLCGPVVVAEAAEQRKDLAHHWAHLVIHGVLHLLGFEHETPRAAARMEALERDLLAGLGVPDPYLARE